MKVVKSKLVLNKETIADLKNRELKEAVAGAGTNWTCYTGPPMHCMDPSVDIC